VIIWGYTIQYRVRGYYHKPSWELPFSINKTITYYVYFRTIPRHHHLHLYGCLLINMYVYIHIRTLYTYHIHIYIYKHDIYIIYIWYIYIYLYKHKWHTYDIYILYIYDWYDRVSGPLRHGGNLRRSLDFTWPVATWMRQDLTWPGPRGGPLENQWLSHRKMMNILKSLVSL
jgi:hypothetical protein